jgi:plasmid replication initiation protein
MEFVLPDWFYRGVLDRSLVLAIDPAYFHLTGGIERWLYRVARKHAGRQPLPGYRPHIERHCGHEWLHILPTDLSTGAVDNPGFGA